MKKRLLSMLMAVLMIASLVPATALAAGTCDPANDDVTTVNIEKTASHPGIVLVYCNEHDKIIKGSVSAFAEAKDACESHKNAKNVVTEVLQEGTCDQPKISVNYCSKCGAGLTATGTDATGTSAFVIDKSTMGKHVYTKFEVSYEPTCNDDGWGYTTCDKCGEPVFVANADEAMYYLYYAYIDEGLTVKPYVGNTTYKIDYTKVSKADAQKVYAMFAQKDHSDPATLVTPTEDVVLTKLVQNDANGVYHIESYVAYKAAVKATHAETVSGYAKLVDGAYVPVEVKSGTASTTAWLDADETGAGYTADTYCPSCGLTVVASKEEASLNTAHKIIRTGLGYYPYMDADGGHHDGYTDSWKCTTCSEVWGGTKIAYDDFYKSEYTLAEWNAHVNKLAEYKIADDYSDNTQGKKTYGYEAKDIIMIGVVPATCKAKGSTGTEWVITADANDKLGMSKVADAKTTDMIAHKWVEVKSKDATCSTYGWTVSHYYVCNNIVVNEQGKKEYCNEVRDGSVITAVGTLDPVATAKVLVEATCKHGGLTVIVDKSCGNLMCKHEIDYKGNCVVYVPAVAHKAGELVNVKEATCTEKGYTGDAFCVWCNTQLVKGSETALKEHTPVNVEKVPATCTENGTEAGTKCSVCETVLSGCEVITAEGHKYVKQDDAVAATCTEAGKEASEKCSVCDDVIEGKVIDALGHKYENGVCTACGAKDPEYVAPEFKDAASIAEYAKEAVTWAANAQVVKGDDMGNFNPTANITRQDFVTMLWRLKGEAASDQALTFTDKANIAEYAATAVAWAVENGYIKGYEDGSFAPTANITRAEIVTILDRIAGNAKAEKEATFTDVVGHWAAAEIAWAAEKGVVNGVGDNKFAPDDNATRQDTVVMLYRFANLK